MFSFLRKFWKCVLCCLYIIQNDPRRFWYLQGTSRHLQDPIGHLPNFFQTPTRNLRDSLETLSSMRKFLIPSSHLLQTFQTAFRHNQETFHTPSRSLPVSSKYLSDTLQTHIGHTSEDFQIPDMQKEYFCLGP